MMKTYAYLRVSSPKHNGKSRQDTASQKRAIERYAKANQLRPTYSEDYASGRSTKRRNALAALLQAVKPNDIILTTELSRVSRSVKDCLGLVETLLEANVKLVCVNQGLTFDNSPFSRFSLALLAALAELESSIKSERIKAGLEATNKRSGRAPNPNRATIRRERATGASLKDLAEKFGLSKQGISYICSQ